MFLTRRTISVAVLLLGLFGWVGCAGSQQISSESPEQALKTGKQLYQEGSYTRAIDYFQHAFDYGRTHEWADDAQFYLAKSYLKNEEYILAADEYTRFIELYRQDPRRSEAAFERALAYYKLSPPFQLDQTDTRRAINYLRLFVEQYPSSEFADQGGQMLQELRNKLAHREYYAAQLYERRELYEAAALTYERVLNKYPETKWTDNALLGAIGAHIRYSEVSIESKQAERLQKALDSYQQFIQLFPDSPLLKEAEKLYAQAQSQMSDLQG